MTESTRTSARSGTRARYANGERRRAELVAAAFRVFAENGFERLSVRQIAEAIGTSHTLLLHHFGSKAALLEAVLARREEIEGPGRLALMENRGLLDTVPEVMRHNAEIRGVIRLDVTLRAEADRPEHPAHDFIRRRDADFVGSVRTELERELDAGRLRPDLDLSVVARQITALIEGIQVAWLHDETIDMAAHLEAFMSLIRKPR
ncbi:TetR/AcrR family transcriptional regulator [Streptomyces sp. NPDC088812]|uniref:TetR/AcrR family transcriptional regulator n=1 Tax=Streptomyces sp. NPDC088812 TaxID=3365905 RepID=UPI00382C75CE